MNGWFFFSFLVVYGKNYSVEFWKIILCLLSMQDRYTPSQNVGNKCARLTTSHQRNAFAEYAFPFCDLLNATSSEWSESYASSFIYGSSRVIEMKGKSRQQIICWDDLLEVIQMNNVKLRSYFYSYVSFQLNVPPHYQYLDLTCNHALTDHCWHILVSQSLD